MTELPSVEHAAGPVTTEEIRVLMYDQFDGDGRNVADEVADDIAALVEERTAAAVDEARREERDVCAKVADDCATERAYTHATLVETTRPDDPRLTWVKAKQSEAERIRDAILARTPASAKNSGEGGKIVPLPGLRCSGCGKVAPDDPRADMAAAVLCGIKPPGGILGVISDALVGHAADLPESGTIYVCGSCGGTHDTAHDGCPGAGVQAINRLSAQEVGRRIGALIRSLHAPDHTPEEEARGLMSYDTDALRLEALEAAHISFLTPGELETRADGELVGGKTPYQRFRERVDGWLATEYLAAGMCPECRNPFANDDCPTCHGTNKAPPQKGRCPRCGHDPSDESEREAALREQVAIARAETREAQGMLRDMRGVYDAAAEKREEEWQGASGLERGGDPGGVTPEVLRAYQEKREAAVARLMCATRALMDLSRNAAPEEERRVLAEAAAALDAVKEKP